MLTTVVSFIRQHRLFRKNAVIIVGVSGGPDSVTLLHVLSRLAREYRLTLHCAHLDHGLRPGSRRDAAFVRALGAQLGIPVTVARRVVRAGKGSVEALAREARLAFFSELARKHKADCVALGHTRDDQAETVLMRILRGTGLAGLGAMQPKRRIGELTVIRPLLGVDRRSIERYLKRYRLSAVRDETNRSDIYFRNRIRNKLIPHLSKHYSAQVKQRLSSLAESAAADYDYLSGCCDRYLRRYPHGRLPLSVVRRWHPALRRMIFRGSIARLTGNTRRLTYKHMQELEDLLFARPTGSVVDLPQRVSVKKTAQALVFSLFAS